MLDCLDYYPDDLWPIPIPIHIIHCNTAEQNMTQVFVQGLDLILISNTVKLLVCPYPYPYPCTALFCIRKYGSAENICLVSKMAIAHFLIIYWSQKSSKDEHDLGQE